ncbi:MAG: hypothetical protein II563_05105, partial [Treponema sp.]|nr:hypothetical protein [Treponema sp.]
VTFDVEGCCLRWNFFHQVQSTEFIADGNDALEFFLVFGIRNKHVKAIFDKALEEIRADGTLSKLAIKWFGTDTSSKGKI